MKQKIWRRVKFRPLFLLKFLGYATKISCKCKFASQNGYIHLTHSLIMAVMKYNFKKLIVWQRSKQLASDTILVFSWTSNYPLKDQISRSCVSIPSNIAEWHWRKSFKEQIQFFTIALWSANELETQLDIARDIQIITSEQYSKLSNELYEIYCMLFRLIQSRKALALRT